jgi:peptide/nickel transport system substrate-binding protein
VKRFTALGLVLALILTLGLAGCGSNEGASSENGQSNGEKPSSEGEKVLTIGRDTDMVSFDIHDHNTTSTEAIHTNMFGYLLKRDKTMKQQPDLAVSWENIDETTWRFKLREGVKFHNGDPFTAADVKFTLERIAKDDKLIEHGNYKQIKEVKIIDDYTVEIVTHAAEPALLNRLSRLGSGMLPSKYIEENGWDHFLKNPVGTGPYKFVEWIRDDRLVLEAFGDYFGGQPKWDKVVFRVIPEESTRVAELLTGGVDIAINVPPSDLERIDNNEGTHTAKGLTQRVMMLVVRMTEGSVTADPRVREAIELAIDNKALTESILEGAGTPTRTRVTPGNVGANPELFDTYLYDPERAKQLLKEAGYENGLELTFSAPAEGYLKGKETAELITAMLSEVGITVKLELLEPSKYKEKYRGKKMNELYMIGYGNSMFDAALALSRLSEERAKGETDYNNPEVNRLIEAAMINMNPEEREKQYQQAQEIIANDRPHIYLHQLKALFGVSDRLQFEPRLDEMTYVEDIELK